MKQIPPLNRRQKRWLLVLAAALLLWIILRSGKSSHTEVEVTQPERATLVETVPASGVIRPVVEVKITPDVSGEVVEIYAKEGDSVRAGDLILRIRQDLYLSQVDQATASLGTLRAQYTRQRAEAHQARINYDRSALLFEQGAISTAELQNAKTELDIAQSSLRAAEFAIRSGEAQLKEARENLLKTTLYAPMDGIISHMNVEKGERVVGTSQMSGTELFRIADFSRMEVTVEVGESDIVRIRPGDSVRVEIDAYPRRKFSGTVVQLANSAKVANFGVRIELLPDSLRFLPGMSAAVTILTDRRDSCLALPVSAVFTRNKEACVWVADADNAARMRPVSTGIQERDRIEIREGLSEMDRVVTGPPEAISQTIQEGRKLKLSPKRQRP
jgi:HlyD family secretion protein